MNLLRIDSSARTQSITRILTQAFVDAWRVTHPHGRCVDCDLARLSLPAITDDWSATFRDPAAMNTAQRDYLAASDRLIAQLLAANLIVIGSPMYNFTVSWELKAWIDQIVRMGKTVRHGLAGIEGLAGGRKVVVITARGGDYSTPDRGARLDHQEPYLRDILAFIGLTDISFIHADRQLGQHAAASRAAALQAIEQLARAHAVPGVA